MIVFIGVSGSGKSLQGRMLADEMGYSWLSSGDLLRMLLSGPDRRDMVEGKLLPDQQVIELLDKVLSLSAPGSQCVLDGFPRTTVQADWLIAQQQTNRFKIDKVFHMTLDHTEAKERLLKRSRLDDHETAINQRLSEYDAVTLPLVSKFQANHITVYDIDASQSVELVHNEIVKLVRQG